ncbi:MAG: DUF1800 domain-containing protein [Pseudomonadota bacterium]
MATTDAAIAANRFGFGALPGELKALGQQARDGLLAQLQGSAPLLPGSLPASKELLAQIMAQRQQLPEKRGQQPTANEAVKAVREIYQPAYVGDVMARFRAAVASQRSFVERLVHFWSNHFAVSVDKRQVLGLAGAMEREAIRPHVFGSFADMLLAVEQHPAMLMYLDNQQSIGPNAQAAQVAGRRGRDVGLNENLGREILELHTLGVDGQYTQADVRSLATLITGWSIGGEAERLRGGEPGAFFFREAFHEPGPGVLLGKRYAAGGLDQGTSALRDLAINPHTARHVATKLVRHFIADEPPAAAVDAIAAAYIRSGGDLPTTYRALVNAPDAWKNPLAKFKTPVDYVYSSWRALGMQLGAQPQRELRVFEDLGQRVFQPGSPAGWADSSADWDGSAALMKRLEWAQGIGQRLGVQKNAQQLAGEMLGATLTAGTERAVARAQDGAQALTLLLCSPEFMRR